jgi:drug/metabolite transporter (DMT)-like permease
MSDIENYAEQPMQDDGSQRIQMARTLAIGAGIGALTGMAAAFLLNRRAAREEIELKFTPGDGIKIGLLVLGLLRSIASLADEK